VPIFAPAAGRKKRDRDSNRHSVGIIQDTGKAEAQQVLTALDIVHLTFKSAPFRYSAVQELQRSG
jgi:hypothetical protein